MFSVSVQTSHSWMMNICPSPVNVIPLPQYVQVCVSRTTLAESCSSVFTVTACVSVHRLLCCWSTSVFSFLPFLSLPRQTAEHPVWICCRFLPVKKVFSPPRCCQNAAQCVIWIGFFLHSFGSITSVYYWLYTVFFRRTVWSIQVNVFRELKQ